MRKIEIDDEVFAYLQRHSEPLVDTPNDVLRRALLSDEKSGENVEPERGLGGLMFIIEAGEATPGDQLRHHQPRLHRTHEAKITADGWVELPDGRVFASPSPALKAQTGSDINGWGQYTHVRTGKKLQELREAAKAKKG
ncbi:restriction system modified-DNA reader domain-containing protein [Streptomyces sp. NPDC054861]